MTTHALTRAAQLVCRATLITCALWFTGCRGLDAPKTNDGSFAACCEGRGSCVPSGVLSSELSSQLARDSCNDTLVCAPQAWVEEPKSVPTSCRTVAELEGRCLSTCLPEVAKQADQLDAGSCGKHALCVPCFDPLNGQDTQACRQNGDAPRDPATLFGYCCGDQGRCVPRAQLASSVAESDSQRLGSAGCDDDASLCVPSSWLGEDGAQTQSCRSTSGVEGRCLPSCLPDIAQQADRLPQSSCAEHERCAPCFDPLTGKDTKACEIGKDKPDEPAHVFARCCQGAGRCVPEPTLAESVSSDQLQRLAADSCKLEADLCVPEAWLNDSSEPPSPTSCRAPGDLEGRCWPECLPDVAAQAGAAVRSSCAAHELCLPCFDPRTGIDTQACRVGRDAPRQAPKTFGSCCEAHGRCVPGAILSSLVSKADVDQLAADGCNAATDRCVPSAWLDGNTSATRCRAYGRLEGRCLSTCLPGVQAQLDTLPRAECADSERCAPCYDPISGSDSGACRLAGDAPVEPPSGFVSCCGEGDAAAGLCIPVALLPAEQAQSLPVDSCNTPDARCVPRALAVDRQANLPSCQQRFLGTALPGVCLASCFIDSRLRGLTSQADCDDDAARCMPCALAAVSGASLPGCP